MFLTNAHSLSRPQRGSFPLDHDGTLCTGLSYLHPAALASSTYLTFPLGECKHVMTKYLACIKKVKGVNEDQCRELAKAYLSCRMDR